MRHAVADFAGDKLPPAQRRLVIEEYAGAGEDIVTFPVIHGNPMAVGFCHAIGAAGPKGRMLVLGLLVDLAEHFAAAGLIEADGGIDQSNGFQHPRHAQGGELAG